MEGTPVSGKTAGALPHGAISLALYLFYAEVEPRVPNTVRLQPYCMLEPYSELAALLSPAPTFFASFFISVQNDGQGWARPHPLFHLAPLLPPTPSHLAVGGL